MTQNGFEMLHRSHEGGIEYKISECVRLLHVCPVPMRAPFPTNSYATSWSAWQRLMGEGVGTKAELNFEPRINGWNQDSDRIQIVYRIYVFPRAGLDFELFSQVFYF